MATEKGEVIQLHETVEVTRSPESQVLASLAKRFEETYGGDKKDLEVLKIIYDELKTAGDKSTVLQVAKEVLGDKLTDWGGEAKEWIEDVAQKGEVEPGYMWSEGYQKLRDVFDIDDDDQEVIADVAKMVGAVLAAEVVEKIVERRKDDKEEVRDLTSEEIRESQRKLQEAQDEYAKGQGGGGERGLAAAPRDEDAGDGEPDDGVVEGEVIDEAETEVEGEKLSSSAEETEAEKEKRLAKEILNIECNNCGAVEGSFVCGFCEKDKGVAPEIVRAFNEYVQAIDNYKNEDKLGKLVTWYSKYDSEIYNEDEKTGYIKPEGAEFVKKILKSEGKWSDYVDMERKTAEETINNRSAQGSDIFRTKEIEMTDERMALARKILIDLIEGSGGIPALEPTLAALEGRIAKLAEEWGGYVSEDAIEIFRKELAARLNLKQVSEFWAEVVEYSDKDAARVGLKERVATAPILKKETYKWLMEGGEILVLEKGSVEKENLREEVDKALGFIWTGMMNESIKYKDPRGVLDIYDEYANNDGLSGVHKDSFILAWRLAEAEMWIAEKGGKPALHPAVRVINFAGIRWSKRDLGGSATYGGRRLYFEHREKRGREQLPEETVVARGISVFELSDDELQMNPYQREGRGFAGTGLFFVGTDRLATRRAVREGRYLEYLRSQWDQTEAFSPQEKAMKSLSESGIKVFETMKELVGGEAKYVNADKVGALVPWVFMISENVWSQSGDNKDEAINRMFIEASKSLIWGASLANEDNIVDPSGTNKMLPLGELNKILYGLVAAVDPRDNDVGSYVGRRKVVEADDIAMGSRNLSNNKRDVKEIVDWYGREVVGRLRNEIYTNNPLKAIGNALGIAADKFKYLRDRGQLTMFMKGDMDFKPRQYYLSRGLGIFGF